MLIFGLVGRVGAAAAPTAPTAPTAPPAPQPAPPQLRERFNKVLSQAISQHHRKSSDAETG